MATKDPRTVHSVDKAMELLELLLQNRLPMSLQELSAATGYPKSTVHALLATLRRHEMVRQDEEGRYALGIRLFECGCAVSAGWDVSRLAGPYLEKLAAQTGAGAFLSVLEGDHVISFDQCAGGDGLVVIPEVGSRLPLHATSQGKLFLSQLSDSDALQRLQRAGLHAYTPHTTPTPVNCSTPWRSFAGMATPLRTASTRSACAPWRLRSVIGTAGPGTPWAWWVFFAGWAATSSATPWSRRCSMPASSPGLWADICK